MTPTPYYDHAGITIYHGDCREILPLLQPGSVDLVLTDPPYGINLDTANQHRQRGLLASPNDYLPVHGDDAAFDPLPLLRFPRVVLFGANHYASRLPESASWLVWDKNAGLNSRRLLGFNDNADAELIWTNIGGPVRILRHQWNGLMKATERAEARVHPTQKPAALMLWLLEHYGTPDGLTLDPYAGSGSTLVAAKQLGRRAIGIEIEERYCEIAVKRLAQEVMPLEVSA